MTHFDIARAIKSTLEIRREKPAVVISDTECAERVPIRSLLANADALEILGSDEIASKSIHLSFCIITNAGVDQRRTDLLMRLLASIPRSGVQSGEYEVVIAGAVPTIIAERYPEAKLVHAPDEASRGMVCHLRNRTLDVSRGEWIVHCDDDIVFTENYWQGIRHHLQNADIVSCKLLNPNGTRYWDWAAYVPGRGQTLLPYDVQDPFVYVTGGHGIYRAAAMKSLRWPEHLKHGDNEEFEVAARARAAGLRVAFAASSTVFLQYHHCDADATIHGRQPAPDNPSLEFRRAIGLPQCTSDSIPQVFKHRIRHKLSTTATNIADTRTPVHEPTVSILVCCHKFLQRFRIFVQSILTQNYEHKKIELVVSNPQSPDGLADYIRVLKDSEAAVRITEVSVDSRYYRNRGYLIQRAFEACNGEIVVGMDADLVLPSDFLRRICLTLSKHPNCVLGVNRAFLPRKTTARVIAGLLNPQQQFPALVVEDQEEHEGYRGVLGYCQATRREHWAKVGYPEEFDSIAKSDVEFIERLSRIGVTTRFLQDLKVLHLNHTRNWSGVSEFC